MSVWSDWHTHLFPLFGLEWSWEGGSEAFGGNFKYYSFYFNSPFKITPQDRNLQSELNACLRNSFVLVGHFLLSICSYTSGVKINTGPNSSNQIGPSRNQKHLIKSLYNICRSSSQGRKKHGWVWYLWNSFVHQPCIHSFIHSLLLHWQDSLGYK